MYKLILAVAVLLGGIMNFGCGMFQEKLTESDLTAPELEAKSLQVIDPKGQFKNAKSYYLKQIITDDGVFVKQKSIIITQFLRPDNLIITAFSANGKPQRSIVIGGNGSFEVDYQKKAVKDLPEEVAKTSRAMLKINEPGASYSDLFDNVKIFRKELDGNDYYLLRCTNSGDNKLAMDVYYDPESFLPYRYEYTDKDGNKSSSTILEYTKNTNVILPRKTESYSGVTGDTMLVEVYDYILDSEVDKNIFKKPVFNK
ncbi:MAG: hypothetical protein RRY34_07885 [Victivallaceae bacterium]